MQEIDVLYDHYKETFELSKTAQTHRNRCFVILCFLETMSFLMINQSDIPVSILSGIINKYSELPVTFGVSVIQTLLWVLLAYTLIRYVQHNIYIERQYGYIEELETQISKALDGMKFDRESMSYLSDYPVVLDLIDIFYKWFIPLLFIAINAARIVVEWREFGVGFTTICDSVICLFIVIISCLYILAIHPRISKAIKCLFRRKKNG